MTAIARIEPEPTAIQTVAVERRQLALKLAEAVATGALAPEVAKAAVDMYKDLQREQARESFSDAFTRLRGAMPRIIAHRGIPDRDGTIRSTFASLDDIKRQVDPILLECGFVDFWDVETADEKRISVKYTLMHREGHTISNTCSVRVSAPPGTSGAQADGSTISYAKRYSMCNLLGITIGTDNDGRAEGDFITPEQAAELRQRVHKCQANEPLFLKLADANTYEEIRQNKYAELDRQLRRKEKATRKAGA